MPSALPSPAELLPSPVEPCRALAEPLPSPPEALPSPPDASRALAEPLPSPAEPLPSPFEPLRAPPNPAAFAEPDRAPLSSLPSLAAEPCRRALLPRPACRRALLPSPATEQRRTQYSTQILSFRRGKLSSIFLRRQAPRGRLFAKPAGSSKPPPKGPQMGLWLSSRMCPRALPPSPAAEPCCRPQHPSPAAEPCCLFLPPSPAAEPCRRALQPSPAAEQRRTQYSTQI